MISGDRFGHVRVNAPTEKHPRIGSETLLASVEHVHICIGMRNLIVSPRTFNESFENLEPT